MFVTIVKKRREESKEALETNALGAPARGFLTNEQQKAVGKGREERSPWKRTLGGFLREGLSDGKVAARDCDEMQRALTTIVELFRAVLFESHNETLVIA